MSHSVCEADLAIIVMAKSVHQLLLPDSYTRLSLPSLFISTLLPSLPFHLFRVKLDVSLAVFEAGVVFYISSSSSLPLGSHVEAGNSLVVYFSVLYTRISG